MRKSLWFGCLFLLCTWGGPLAAQPAVDESSAPNFEYGSYSLQSISFNVDGSATIEDLAIQMNITTVFAYEVIGLAVTSPEGTAINLIYYMGGSGDDIDCVFSDIGTVLPTFDYSGTSGEPSKLDVDGGLIRPIGSSYGYTNNDVDNLSTGFDGEVSDGTWNLDVYSFVNGTVNLWGVKVYTVDHPTSVICSAGAELGDVNVAWTNGSSSDLDSIEIWQGGDMLASLGPGDADLAAGGANSFDVFAMPVPQQAEFQIFSVVAGEYSQPGTCTQSLMNDPTAIVSAEPDYPFSGGEPEYVGILEFAEPTTTIGDIIVDIEYTHGFLPYSEAYVASWSGTVVGLFDPDGSSSGTVPASLKSSFWRLGRAFGDPFDAGEAMQPSGPGGLEDFVGQETIDPSTGEASWAIVVNSFYSFYSGVVNSVAIKIFAAAGGATEAPTGVTCDETGELGVMSAGWTNGGDYDAVAIYVDNVVSEVRAGPFSAGSTDTFDFTATSLPDQVSVHVQGKSATGQWSQKVGCSVVLTVDAPSGLTCSSADSGVVDLSWLLPAVDYYAEIIITADGTDVDSIDGDATSWSSSDVGLTYDVPSVHQFSVRGAAGGSESSSVSCTIMLLEPAEAEACASEDAGFGYGTTSSDVTISEAGTLESAELTLSTSDGGMYYAGWFLDAPSGTTIDLKTFYNGSLFSFSEVLVLIADGGTTMSSLSSDEWDDGLTVAPLEALSNLVGEAIDGTWTLRTSNIGYGQTFHNWCLRLNYCSVLPPTDLTCEGGDDYVDLAWFLGDTYDSINIVLDGAVLDSVPGDTEFFTAEALEVGRHTFRVVGINDAEGCEAPSGPCNASIGFTEICKSAPATVYPYGGSDVEFSFPDPIIVGGVEVVFDLASGFGSTGYYNIFLVSPSETSVQLQKGGTYYSGGFKLIWSDDGDTAGGTYLCDFCLIKPFGELGDFFGEIADGDWNLSIDGSGDTGTLNLGCLAIYEGCKEVPPADVTCENVAGTKNVLLEWVNSADYSEIRIRRNGNDIATLDGSAEEYTDEGLLSDFYTYQAVAYNATLDCEAGSRFCKTSVGITEICNDTDVAGSGSTLTSTVEVTDDIALDEVRVKVVLDTPYAYMQTLKIESPAGTDVVLYETYYTSGNLPGSYANFNCTFADEGTAIPPSSFDCGGCLIDADESLAGLADESPIGTWTLSDTSFYSGYARTIDQFCIQLMVGCPIGRPIITSCLTEDGLGLPPVIIEWEVNDAYDSQSVMRNGTIIATVGGDESTYADADLTDGGFVEYRILATSDSLDCSKPSPICKVGVGLISVCSEPYSVLNNVTKLDFMDWDNPAIDTAVECYEKAGEVFDTAAAEVQVSVDVAMSLYAYYVDLLVYSPDNTAVNLKDGYSSVTSGSTILVTFSKNGVTLNSSSQACECLVLPTGPGSMSDFEGADPRGEWLMLSDSWYSGYSGYLNKWCVEVYMTSLPVCPEIPVDDEVWFKRGDCSNNGTFSGLADAQFLLNYAFNSGATPGCLTACDASGNNTLSALPDALYMLAYAFQGGTIPPAPGPNACGADPQDPVNGDAGGCATENATCDAAH